MVAHDPVPAVSETEPDARERSRQVRRVAVSSLLGTTIEYYDFLLYSTMAALVFGRIYFPSDDPAVATIAAFGSLAAGYVARPLGGVIFGHFGDRLGRKTTLICSMALMGVASVLIGLLPTYASVGVAAPLLLIVLRVIQGIAVGGEYGGAALMVVEHADRRRRGAWVGIMQMGSPLGMLLSTGAVALVTTLPDEAFLTWGWRVPFLASALLLLVGLYVRIGVSESPLFAEAAAGAPREQAPPLMQLLRRPRVLLLAAAAGIGPFALTALISTHSIAYATAIGYERSDVLAVLLGTSVVGLVLIPLFSALSDYWGRRRMVLTGAVGAVLYALPMYVMVDSGEVGLLAVALLVGQVFQNAMYAPLAPMLSEMFGTRTRYTGVSLGYQMAGLIGSGFTPMIAAVLVAATGGSSLPLSGIVAVAALVSIAAVLSVSETNGRDMAQEQGAA